MAKSKTNRGLAALITFVVLLLLAEAVLLTAVFVSPGLSGQLAQAVADAKTRWEGAPGSPGISDKIDESADRLYDKWITPLWSLGTSPRGNAEFTACVDCHNDYASRRRFSAVYMNHPLHAQVGVVCATCHTANAHPKPALPEEATCEECHQEVQQKGQCGLCHPPASLPHFYLLGEPRDTAVQCETCHRRGVYPTANDRLVHVGRFSGSPDKACKSWHSTTTCRACHAEQHPADWVGTHGATGEEGATTCYECHTGNWCASRCHPYIPSIGDFSPQPLPRGSPSP